MTEKTAVKKTWTLDAVREWALAEFPDTFAAITDLGDISFEELDDEKSRSRFPADGSKRLLCIGHYDDPSQDSVTAFVYGEHYNQVGYLQECSDAYVRLNSESISKVEVHEPLCNIGDGTGAATLDRLRAVTCWCFLAAGHIPHFRDFESFKREFQKACAYIKMGWPEFGGLRRRSRSSSVEPLSEQSTLLDFDLPASSGVLAKIEMGDFRSEDDAIDPPQDQYPFSAPQKMSRSSLSKSANPHAPPPKVVKTEDVPKDNEDMQSLLNRVNHAYTTLEKGNKRLKLSLDEANAKDAAIVAQLRAEIASLAVKNEDLTQNVSALQKQLDDMTTDNARSQNQLRTEKDKYENLSNLYKVLMGKLMAAQKSTAKAETRAKEAEKKLQEPKGEPSVEKTQRRASEQTGHSAAEDFFIRFNALKQRSSTKDDAFPEKRKTAGTRKSSQW